MCLWAVAIALATDSGHHARGGGWQSLYAYVCVYVCVCAYLCVYVWQWNPVDLATSSLSCLVPEGRPTRSACGPGTSLLSGIRAQRAGRPDRLAAPPHSPQDWHTLEPFSPETLLGGIVNMCCILGPPGHLGSRVRLKVAGHSAIFDT